MLAEFWGGGVNSTDIHRDGLSLSRRLRLARQDNSRKWGVWLLPVGMDHIQTGPSEAVASRTPTRYASYIARIPSNNTRVARQSSSLHSRICCLIAGSRVLHQFAYHSIEAAPDGLVSRHLKPRKLASVLIE